VNLSGLGVVLALNTYFRCDVVSGPLYAAFSGETYGAGGRSAPPPAASAALF
jgi:hypothetical protein